MVVILSKGNKSVKVRENFDFYNQLKDTAKGLSASAIYLSPRKNHIGRVIGESPLLSTLGDSMLLEVESNSDSLQDFQFKIIDRSFIPQPLFRFDSDGAPHNNLGDIPLSARQVKTPHFHAFDKNGVEIAYRTDTIEKYEAKMVSDHIFAFKHFAEEENIIYGKDPFIGEADELIPPENVAFDPLKGEDFNE